MKVGGCWGYFSPITSKGQVLPDSTLGDITSCAAHGIFSGDVLPQWSKEVKWVLVDHTRISTMVVREPEEDAKRLTSWDQTGVARRRGMQERD